MVLHEEERTTWQKSLRKPARATMIPHLLIFPGLACLCRFMGERALCGHPMALTGVMYGMTGTLIGCSVWLIRTSSQQLGRGEERPRTEPNIWKKAGTALMVHPRRDPFFSARTPSHAKKKKGFPPWGSLSLTDAGNRELT